MARKSLWGRIGPHLKFTGLIPVSGSAIMLVKTALAFSLALVAKVNKASLFKLQGSNDLLCAIKARIHKALSRWPCFKVEGQFNSGFFNLDYLTWTIQPKLFNPISFNP